MRTSVSFRILKIPSVLLMIGIFACIQFPTCAAIGDLWESMDSDPYYGYFLREQDKQNNALPHPYLAGYYSEDRSEITITGMKVTSRDYGGDPSYVFRKDVVIPDEIGGVPVTVIEKEAFEEYTDTCSHYSKKPLSVLIGRNVRSIGSLALNNFDMVIIGKNVIRCDGAFGENRMICCYENSHAYKSIRSDPNYDVIYGNNDWYTITFIDESHLKPLQDSVKIDENLTLHLPWNATAQTLTEYVSVDGDAKITVLGNMFGNGTQIELVNSTYGTIDNTYTVRLGLKPVTLKDTTVYAKTTFKLTPETADDGCTRTYTSDNPAVADVDEDGNVTAKQSGTAKITVTVTDEYGNEAPKSTCTVTVNYTWWQWLIRIFLFGWLWY